MDDYTELNNYIKFIRTSSGDKQIDYESLANLPTINGKDLINDVTLTAADIEAVSTSNFNTTMDELATELATEIETVSANANGYTDQKVVDLVDGAPNNLNTLGKLATAISEKANATHTHTINDISDLQTTLDSTLEQANKYTDDKIAEIDIPEAMTNAEIDEICGSYTSSIINNIYADLAAI